MSMGDQIGVDHIDREADWPHILNKQTRFCNEAIRVTNMRWGRRCWDCSHHSTGVQLANNASACRCKSFDPGACQVAPIDPRFAASKST